MGALHWLSFLAP